MARFCMLAVAAMMICVLTGCLANGGFRGQTTDTVVSLSQANYKVIKAGARGDSHGFLLLGLLPITSPGYASAKGDLYDSVGENLTGRAIALANQTEDHSYLYLILFAIRRNTITADVIEFTK